MKITRPIKYIEVEKRLTKYFKKTDYDLYHKNNGRIVVHFFDEKYLENFPIKDGRIKGE